ncbi:MAG: methylated-DNA--[protein]-cysteine S-methyltransferase, partial [Balneolaceae bacterium]
MLTLNFSSPIGWLNVYAGEDSILELRFTNQEPEAHDDSGFSPLLIEAKQQLQAYFQGKLTKFNLPLAPEGTSFQEQVWGDVSRIPFGKTSTYGGLATSLGKAD